MWTWNRRIRIITDHCISIHNLEINHRGMCNYFLDVTFYMSQNPTRNTPLDLALHLTFQDVSKIHFYYCNNWGPVWGRKKDKVSGTLICKHYVQKLFPTAKKSWNFVLIWCNCFLILPDEEILCGSSGWAVGWHRSLPVFSCL